MLLRKRLGSGKLVDIRQDGLERILFLDFECVNELGDLVTVTLACEIMGRCSNLVIICGGKVVDSIKRVDEDMSRERLVLPGMNYTMPPRDERLNFLEAEPEEIKERLADTEPKELSKALIRIFEGISPILAREWDAEAVTKEANDKAAQVIKDANIEAEKAVANANVAAEACIKEANDQARNTVNEANAHADKVNAMSKTVREMLLTEIESINSKFTDIASVLNNLTGQCSGRMNDAQNIISEARKAVDTQKNDGVVKRSEPPRAEFKPSKAPKGDISELPSAKINEVKNDNNADLNKNNGFNNKPAQPNNQANAQNQQNKPAQGSNKSASFNFDMAELLKAAEEEAAKDGEN